MTCRISGRTQAGRRRNGMYRNAYQRAPPSAPCFGGQNARTHMMKSQSCQEAGECKPRSSSFWADGRPRQQHQGILSAICCFRRCGGGADEFCFHLRFFCECTGLLCAFRRGSRRGTNLLSGEPTFPVRLAGACHAAQAATRKSALHCSRAERRIKNYTSIDPKQAGPWSRS